MVLLLSQTVAESKAASLIAFAELPADTFSPGPTSGQFIEPANQRQTPFENRQPIQGISALIHAENGTFLALSDNGFGRRDNSSDYILSIYQLQPDFRTVSGGAGSIKVSKIIQLSDPDGLLPYPATRQHDRLLTGADLDPESFQRTADGSFWVGEEFNPSVVHFNKKGEMLSSPFRLKGLSSEDNPSGEPVTLPRSRGFEGMAISPDAKWLYPMLEGTLVGGQPGLNIYTFDIEQQRFLNPHANQPSYRYRLDDGATAIGAFTLFSNSGGLVIERDSAEGNDAILKRVYKIDFNLRDAEGFMIKTLVADLLNINDTDDLNRDGHQNFSFSFWTIESLVVINRTTLGIANDNNYPLGQARDHSASQPDGSEFILIEVASLWD